MITLSRYNRLETLWGEVTQNNRIPDEIKIETEQKLLKNTVKIRAQFFDFRIKGDDLREKLTECYSTLNLVEPLLKDAANRLGNDTKLIVTDPNGVVISCYADDIIGYCCPAADIINSNKNLQNCLGRGNLLEVSYDNGIHTQLIPILNEYGEIQFYWGATSYSPIATEVSNILYLTAQLVQQRYIHLTMINEYTNSFINAIPEHVMLLDNNGRIINVNQQCLNMLQLDKDMLLGMPFDNLIAGSSLTQSILTAESHSRFKLRLWDRDVSCRVTTKKLITTPYGNQLVLLFDRIDSKEVYPAVYPVNDDDFSFDKIIGNTAEIKKIKLLAREAARSPATILLTGESGTGKELFAQAIHKESQRTGPFVAINCGAIPSDLIQSELFGYEEGAFTGARKKGNPGKFEIADGGTILLDEIGEMSPDMQVSLLRFLQDKTVTRIGGYSPKKVDVRIIAATNRDLKDEVRKGNFREDLFYRLNVISLKIPPLRERRQDIPLLADYFLKRLCKENNIPVLQLDENAKRNLLDYNWPGNVRELENCIERAFIFRKGTELNFDELKINTINIKKNKETIKADMEQVEREAIENQLRLCGGNITDTANAMGITRQTLYRKMKKLHIKRKDYLFEN
ncbi:MAG TPA: sigma 54-interacting transcriptional regulator [Syntrophomonadaceae bacterium]|nr:sigma 54-interacting transcriptional regulator [Syntrophomonadaceae bacterium]HQE23526.1 sigma 54-interacting transcriptional regulator [Syntrophomonadaceae bacterium]